MRKLLAAIGAAALAIGLSGCWLFPGPSPSPSPVPVTHSPSPSPSPSAACDQTLWDHVYHPYRLQVIDSCKTVTGTVQDIRREDDGDLHILVKLDPQYANLVNSVNVSQENGDLVVEAVCVGTITQSDAVSACQGFASHVTIPSPGEHVQITGSYVVDTIHGWTEIHPVTTISPLKGN